jgi:hypothetical protein
MMAGRTIFAIDDHKSIRHALGEMLGVFGFAVARVPTASFERLGDREVTASWLTCGCPARTESNSSGNLVAERSPFLSFSYLVMPTFRWR